MVNFAFTILEEGSRAQSVLGNHTVAIMKVSETYDEDKGKVYKIQFYLGGDWKFLATVCGLESATADYAYIWCKCPKRERFDMSLKWSINDPAHGARSIEEIKERPSCLKEVNCILIVAGIPYFALSPTVV